MHRAAATPEHKEQLCWSTWSSCSLGTDTGAPLEHMKQRLPGSTESSFAGARGAAALWEQIQVPQWSIMEQQLPWSTESSCVGARAAVALWEQIQVFLGAAAFLEHTEQLCWCICSSGAIESTTRDCCSMFFNGGTVSALREPLLHMLQHSCSLCSREAAAPFAPVEPLYLLPESRCSTCFSKAALCAPGKPLLHLLQWSNCICSQRAAAPHAPA